MIKNIRTCVRKNKKEYLIKNIRTCVRKKKKEYLIKNISPQAEKKYIQVRPHDLQREMLANECK